LVAMWLISLIPPKEIARLRRCYRIVLNVLDNSTNIPIHHVRPVVLSHSLRDSFGSLHERRTFTRVTLLLQTNNREDKFVFRYLSCLLYQCRRSLVQNAARQESGSNGVSTTYTETPFPGKRPDRVVTSAPGGATTQTGCQSKKAKEQVP
jgi:hypothetical protein